MSTSVDVDEYFVAENLINTISPGYCNLLPFINTIGF